MSDEATETQKPAIDPAVAALAQKKAELKQQIAALKPVRDAALAAKDAVALKRARRKIRALKGKLRHAAA